MSRLTRIGAFIAVLVFAFGITALGATKKKAPAKKPATTNNHATQGTTQLKGEYADFGATYTLGKSDPFNITLRSAEYSVEPVRIGANTIVPSADKKLLILHMTYHNPQSQERFVRWDAFDSKIIDTDGMEVCQCAEMLQKSKDKSFATEVQSDQEIMVRCLFKIPDDTDLKTFSTRLDQGRTFVFDVSDVK